MSLRNLGLKCLGPARSPSRRAPPGSLHPQLFEPCPDAVTLDFETSQLLLVTSTNDPTRKVLRLSNRCVGRYANLLLRELVPGCGSRHMSEDEPCAAEAAITTLSLDQTVV